jgi:hypothetical protein
MQRMGTGEQKYHQQLIWLQEAKQIKSFKIQPRYLLQEGFKKGGKTFKKIEYVADFEVLKPDGGVEVIDIRGAITKELLLKRQLFECKYLGSITLLKYKNGQFVEVE